LPKALQSAEKTVPGSKRDDEARYVDNYASVGEKKQVDSYGCNYWVNEDGTGEEMHSDAL